MISALENKDELVEWMLQNVRSECLQLQHRVDQLERQNHRLQLLVEQTFSSLTYSTLQVGSCYSSVVCFKYQFI